MVTRSNKMMVVLQISANRQNNCGTRFMNVVMEPAETFTLPVHFSLFIGNMITAVRHIKISIRHSHLANLTSHAENSALFYYSNLFLCVLLGRLFFP